MSGPDLYAAFKLLPTASSYPGDANLCGSLAESIYMAMLAKQDVNGLKKLNLTIEEEKKAIIADGDWKARHERDKDPRRSHNPPAAARAGANAAKAAQTPGTGTDSLKYADTLRRIAEIEALKKANIVRTEAQTLRTKAQYQVSMIQWFVQRRYEHVLMAARFYNQIWKDGDATLRIDKNSDVSKLFSESVGVSPTVASLDSLSNEAIREAAKYVEAFDLMLTRDELHSASQRLMEAYRPRRIPRPRRHPAAREKTPRRQLRPRPPRTLRHPPGPRLHQNQGTRRPPQSRRQGFPLVQGGQRHRRLHPRLRPRHRGGQGPPVSPRKRQGRRKNPRRHRDLADQSRNSPSSAT